MDRFLPIISADCSHLDVLAIAPQKTINNPGRKNQIVHEFEDFRNAVVSVNSSNIFEIEMQWDYLTESERSTILELFHAETKANGSARTFYWAHPIENNAYVLRFLAPLRTVYKPGLQGVETIKCRVHGSAGQAFSDYTDMSLYVESDAYMRFI